MSAPKLEPLPPWGSALAGASGAVLANALVYPLDIVKTKLQVQVKKRGGDGSDEYYEGTLDAIKKIVQDEGIAGLYSGIEGALLGVASTNFAYFYWYSLVRSLAAKYTGSDRHSTAAELSMGAVAGALAQLFTIPIAVVTTRQQTQPKGEKKGILDTAKEVIDSEDGWTGLWRGLKASLVLVVNPSITYGAYERLRVVLFADRAHLKPWEAFRALSKSLATIATQPLIVAKVGLQSRPPPERKGVPFKSFGEVMAYIIEHEGTLGLFKGIGPQIIKGILVQGVLMMAKERIEVLFQVLFAYIALAKQRRLARLSKQLKERLRPAAADVVEKAKDALPLTTRSETMSTQAMDNGGFKQLLPVLWFAES
ncbi:hypothetical protein DV735_g3538, partial [Chaetothyriales sp. CBS 134920]